MVYFVYPYIVVSLSWNSHTQKCEYLAYFGFIRVVGLIYVENICSVNYQPLELFLIKDHMLKTAVEQIA